MNMRIFAALFIAPIALPGCSTPQPPMELALAPLPAVFERDLPLEQPPALAGRVCKLGTSCLALDPRPFEVCLVGTRRCVDKAQPIPAETPQAPEAEGSMAVGLHGDP